MIQLDIFADAPVDAGDIVLPDHWSAPDGAWEHWNPSLGPHGSWNEARQHRSPEDAIEVYRGKGRWKALVFIALDDVTGLWIGGMQVDAPTAGTIGPPTYYPAAYRSREVCISEWTKRALAQVGKYKQEIESYRAWRVKFDQRSSHAARAAAEDDDEGNE